MSGGVFSLMQWKIIIQDIPSIQSFQSSRASSMSSLLQEDLQGDPHTSSYTKPLKDLRNEVYFPLCLSCSSNLIMSSLWRNRIFTHGPIVCKAGTEIPKPWALFLVGQPKEGFWLGGRGVLFFFFCNWGNHFFGSRGFLLQIYTKYPTYQKW